MKNVFFGVVIGFVLYIVFYLSFLTNINPYPQGFKDILNIEISQKYEGLYYGILNCKTKKNKNVIKNYYMEKDKINKKIIICRRQINE
ncbi:MAG: hypothetical protein CL760_01255 [Chloroflexi bacterium]|nr:hypothetical protein [Chloroflexota bacterium]|tara:strand:- start:24171 stop:24434 length:264 start_codon:yes stop_codon:yes gene_type:complete